MSTRSRLRIHDIQLSLAICSVHEIQAFLVELVSNFEFSATDDIRRLRRELSLVLLPVLEGETGSQMPLRVSLAARDD